MRGVGDSRVRVNLIGTFEFLVHLGASGGGVASTCMRLVLQAFRVRGLGVGFRLCGAGLGRGLVGECFSLPHPVGLFFGAVAHLAGLYVAVLVAFIASHPRDRGDEQQCRDSNYDDQEG